MNRTKATDDLTKLLASFRATHTYKQICIAGIKWEYLIVQYPTTDRRKRGNLVPLPMPADTSDSTSTMPNPPGDFAIREQGEAALLLLPGISGRGDTEFQLMTRFEQRYHVITVNYPASVTTIAHVVEGLIEILAIEGFEEVDVVGGSYSGTIAQCLVRQIPQKVKHLVLDHTSPPNRQRGKIYKLYGKLLALLPAMGIRTVLLLANRLLPRSPTPEQLFWRTYFAEMLPLLTKVDYMSRCSILTDFYLNCTFTSSDLADWTGKMLIIEADTDTFVPRREREALKALYQQAQVYTFRNTGHAAWATHFETFYTVIADFLEERR